MNSITYQHLPIDKFLTAPKCHIPLWTKNDKTITFVDIGDLVQFTNKTRYLVNYGKSTLSPIEIVILHGSTGSYVIYVSKVEKSITAELIITEFKVLPEIGYYEGGLCSEGNNLYYSYGYDENKMESPKIWILDLTKEEPTWEEMIIVDVEDTKTETKVPRHKVSVCAFTAKDGTQYLLVCGGAIHGPNKFYDIYNTIEVYKKIGANKYQYFRLSDIAIKNKSLFIAYVPHYHSYVYFMNNMLHIIGGECDEFNVLNRICYKYVIKITMNTTPLEWFFDKCEVVISEIGNGVNYFTPLIAKNPNVFKIGDVINIIGSRTLHVVSKEKVEVSLLSDIPDASDVIMDEDIPETEYDYPNYAKYLKNQELLETNKVLETPDENENDERLPMIKENLKLETKTIKWNKNTTQLIYGQQSHTFLLDNRQFVFDGTTSYNIRGNVIMIYIDCESEYTNYHNHILYGLLLKDIVVLEILYTFPDNMRFGKRNLLLTNDSILLMGGRIVDNDELYLTYCCTEIKMSNILIGSLNTFNLAEKSCNGSSVYINDTIVYVAEKNAKILHIIDKKRDVKTISLSSFNFELPYTRLELVQNSVEVVNYDKFTDYSTIVKPPRKVLLNLEDAAKQDA
jgi:hypothetical protein